MSFSEQIKIEILNNLENKKIYNSDLERFGEYLTTSVTKNKLKDEFNSLFRAYTDNELLAYKILTPDVMEEFVNIKNNTYGDIDIRILNNKLYIRFLSGNGFDSSALTKDEDRVNLCKSIAVLEEVMNTMDKVKKIIDNKKID